MASCPWQGHVVVSAASAAAAMTKVSKLEPNNGEIATATAKGESVRRQGKKGSQKSSQAQRNSLSQRLQKVWPEPGPGNTGKDTLAHTHTLTHTHTRTFATL